MLISASSARPEIGFRVTGGFSHISYGDYNDFAEYANEEVLPLSGITERYDEMHWVPEFGGEVIVDFLPVVDVGVGFGVISGKSELAVLDIEIFKHTVKAYPITLTGYFEPPLPMPMAKPYLMAGVGLYPSKIFFSYPVVINSVAYMLDADMTKTGYGVHGGAGIEFSVASMISIDFCLKARWIDIQGYEGTSTIQGYGEEDVYLYFDDSAGEVVYGVESTSAKDESKEGSVDLSGYAFTLGIKVAF
jgi:hypothetical protein